MGSFQLILPDFQVSASIYLSFQNRYSACRERLPGADSQRAMAQYRGLAAVCNPLHSLVEVKIQANCLKLPRKK